ncbi:hypothetical protein KO561_04700 [Radiobacillus kanasensis]|uniref:hypothetical protein n=1 Tax=Radiobacillus kanasensis TaxID=2844358 RepID=UPI001E33CE23|nr:hypothetical protein [Radiobacillus kanasensis]UFU00256.1 hypothetical protein KO561_04700 [Radiobacillus kanasensis]
MVPISVDKFVNETVKNNKDVNRKEIKKNILAAVERKKKGAGCIQCDQPIWALGSGVTGIDMCFSCTTGEADQSEDYEIDVVCYNR